MNSSHIKIFYTPIEAAIRWSNLYEQEQFIIGLLDPDRLPLNHQLERWPLIRLNLDRIYDGLLNGDLPFGRKGITCADPELLSSPSVTIRHVDMRVWMSEKYPDQRPDFLFDDYERLLHPAVTVEAVQALVMERDLWRSSSESCQRVNKKLRRKLDAMRVELDIATRPAGTSLSQRAELTYLNIIGALVQLILSETPSGIAYSTFRSQEAIISALLAHHTGLMGVTERTLHAKFAEAKRRLASQII
ncbi:hypothetical protein CF98_07765 [Halopseudomonas bauzanensis]|nr:hypothetical protein CF98_07765 [Halopseudomonas bauzanensis]